MTTPTPWHLYPDLDLKHADWYGRWLRAGVQRHLWLGSDPKILLEWCELLEAWTQERASYTSYLGQRAFDEESGEEY